MNYNVYFKSMLFEPEPLEQGLRIRLLKKPRWPFWVLWLLARATWPIQHKQITTWNILFLKISEYIFHITTSLELTKLFWRLLTSLVYDLVCAVNIEPKFLYLWYEREDVDEQWICINICKCLELEYQECF